MIAFCIFFAVFVLYIIKTIFINIVFISKEKNILENIMWINSTKSDDQDGYLTAKLLSQNLESFEIILAEKSVNNKDNIISDCSKLYKIIAYNATIYRGPVSNHIFKSISDTCVTRYLCNFYKELSNKYPRLISKDLKVSIYPLHNLFKKIIHHDGGIILDVFGPIDYINIMAFSLGDDIIIKKMKKSGLPMPIINGIWAEKSKPIDSENLYSHNSLKKYLDIMKKGKIPLFISTINLCHRFRYIDINNMIKKLNITFPNDEICKIYYQKCYQENLQYNYISYCYCTMIGYLHFIRKTGHAFVIKRDLYIDNHNVSNMVLVDPSKKPLEENIKDMEYWGNVYSLEDIDPNIISLT